MSRRTLFLLAALALTVPARADVRPHPLFTDHMVLQRDVPLPVWGTARPGEAVTVTLNNQSDTATAGDDGHWQALLPPAAAGGPFTLVVAGPNNSVRLTDVLVGEVWVCSGQSNMEWRLRDTFQPTEAIAKSANDKIRLYTVKRNPAGEPQTTCEGQWSICGPDTVATFSAVGYYFGRDLQKALNVPVGLIHTSWGGTPAQAWTSRDKLRSVGSLRYYAEDFDRAMKDFDPEKAAAENRADRARYQQELEKHRRAVVDAKKEGKSAPKAPARPRMRQSPAKNAFAATTLYNGMIAPLLPFPIAGATWYQGESNTGQAYEYRTLLPAMIEDWRARWGREFPFLVVQLAPFGNSDSNGQTYAELREAQLLTAQKTPKVGLAVITDVGDETDIHPAKKEPVGHRLALLARAIAYGEKVAANGPMYKAMKVEGNKAVLSFDHVGGGLECRGDKLVGFEVCGEDRKFRPAEAVVRGDTVVVSCEGIETPKAVRYGFHNYVAGLNLWNEDGLPATPFRTDSYPGVTEKR